MSKKPTKTTRSRPPARVSAERRRVNLKLDRDLAEFAFSYAAQRDTNVTQLITDFFVALRNEEEKKLTSDAEQI